MPPLGRDARRRLRSDAGRAASSRRPARPARRVPGRRSRRAPRPGRRARSRRRDHGIEVRPGRARRCRGSPPAPTPPASAPPSRPPSDEPTRARSSRFARRSPRARPSSARDDASALEIAAHRSRRRRRGRLLAPSRRRPSTCWPTCRTTGATPTSERTFRRSSRGCAGRTPRGAGPADAVGARRRGRPPTRRFAEAHDWAALAEAESERLEDPFCSRGSSRATRDAAGAARASWTKRVRRSSGASPSGSPRWARTTLPSRGRPPTWATSSFCKGNPSGHARSTRARWQSSRGIWGPTAHRSRTTSRTWAKSATRGATSRRRRGR